MTNPIAAWLAALAETATAWEVAASLVGIGACGYALWGAIDNVFDLRYVKREGVVGGPRWITASFLLAAHVLFLAGWLGYTHVALTAAYLPGRADLSSGAASEIAVMRLAYGVFGLLAQAALRLMRLKLRSLRREQWAPLFGDVERFRLQYHESQARVRRLEADVALAQAEAATARADKHDMGTVASRRGLALQLVLRWADEQHVEIPEPLRRASEGAMQP